MRIRVGISLGLWACFLTPSAFPQSSSDTPIQFIDVAREAGIEAVNVWGELDVKRYIIESKGSGLAFIDYNADGFPDLYLSNGTRFGIKEGGPDQPTTHLYRNNRNGTFTDVSQESGIARSGWQTGVCVGDYDNDGWEDLFAGFWGKSVLFRNKGDGTFEDVTRSAGVLEDKGAWTTGCTFLDYDRDGYLDLFAARYVDLDLETVPAPGENANCLWKGMPVFCGPVGLTGGTNRLLHNNGDGTFTDRSQESGILAPGRRYSITPVSCDLDDDRWPDIYVAVDSEPSLLFVNQRDGTFVESGMLAGTAYSEDGKKQAGMGLGIGDFDGNGRLDIFKTNFQHDTNNLYQNLGDGTFRDIARSAGLGSRTEFVNWGAGFVDYDNDGFLDIFYVTGHVYPDVDTHNARSTMDSPRIVFKNLGNSKFADVSSSLGPGVSARFSSRGCAFADYDNDGDVDVAVLNMNERYSLLRCDGGNRNHWVQLRLIGTRSNRSAIGARVRVNAGGRTQTAEVVSGGSVMSQNDLRLHFGLGSASRIDWIEILWPRGETPERFETVNADKILTLREGEGIISREKPGN